MATASDVIVKQLEVSLELTKIAIAGRTFGTLSREDGFANVFDAIYTSISDTVKKNRRDGESGAGIEPA